jgi:hypothetical protein
MPMLEFWIEVRVGKKEGIAAWNCVRGGIYDQHTYNLADCEQEI